MHFTAPSLQLEFEAILRRNQRVFSNKGEGEFFNCRRKLRDKSDYFVKPFLSPRENYR